jgi:hypothetical protein
MSDQKQYGLYVGDSRKMPRYVGSFEEKIKLLDFADLSTGWIIAPIGIDWPSPARISGYSTANLAWRLAGLCFILFALFVAAMTFKGC